MRLLTKNILYCLLLSLPLAAVAEARDGGKSYEVSLHEAALLGDEFVVSACLERGVDPNERNEIGATPLHYAAYGGSLEALRLLLLEGAEIDAVTATGDTVLHYVASFSCNDAFMQRVKEWQRIWGVEGVSVEAMCRSMRLLKPLYVEELVGSGAEVDARDIKGVTPLMLAVNYGKEEIVDALIRVGANSDIIADTSLGTALLLAIHSGNTRILKTLLKAEADVNLCLKGFCPLIYAVLLGRTEMFELLLNAGADVTVTFPLVFNGLLSLMKEGVSHEINSSTPLFSLVCLFGDLKMVGLLLAKGLDVEISEEFVEATPLHQAAMRGHLAIVEALVDAGANIYKENVLGQTARKLAEIYRFPSARELLCRNDEDKNSGFIKVPCLNQHEAIVDYLQSLEKRAKDEL